jgi:5'-nucleotidase
MSRARLLLTLFLSISLLAPLGARQSAPAPYRILVSNDDGVRAPGIAALAEALRAIGDVTIVGPAENYSGAGHSVVTSQPVTREDLTLPNGMKAIGLAATPASTMNIALKNIMTSRPDLVVTGVNRGYNLGMSVYVSGTAAGARQAAMAGIPAIASSLAEAGVPGDFGVAAAQVLTVARRVKEHGLPRYAFLNVNVPPRPGAGYKGFQVASLAMIPGGVEQFAETTHPGTGRTLYWSVYKEGVDAPEGTDIWAVNNGYVSVTPLKVSETDPSMFETVRGWLK